MIDADFVKEIDRLSKAAAAVEIVEVAALSNDYVAIARGGNIEFKELPPSPIDIKAWSTVGFIDATKRLQAARNEFVTVYVSPSKVVAIADNAYGLQTGDCNTVTLGLKLSEAFKLAESKIVLAHATLCRHLRTTLHGCVGDAFAESLASLTTTAGNTGKSKIAHGTEELGGELTRSIVGDKALPANCIIVCPVFFGIEEWVSTHSIECAFEISWEGECPEFQILPRNGEIARATSQSLNQIVAAISKADKDWCVIAATP